MRFILFSKSGVPPSTPLRECLAHRTITLSFGIRHLCIVSLSQPDVGPIPRNLGATARCNRNSGRTAQERDFFLSQLHDYGSNSTDRDDSEPPVSIQLFGSEGGVDLNTHLANNSDTSVLLVKKYVLQHQRPFLLAFSIPKNQQARDGCWM